MYSYKDRIRAVKLYITGATKRGDHPTAWLFDQECS
jgi:hypothetical protein